MNGFLKKVIFFITFMLLFNFNFTFTSSAAGSASNDGPKVVRVGYYQNEVFEDGASDGAIKKGYAYEYYRKISEYTGWEYEYVYGDFVSIYNMLVNGEVDLVAGLANTEERASIILFPERPMGWESYGIVKHDDDRSITTDRKTLTGRTIGVLDSAIVGVLNNYLDEQGINAKVVAFNDYETLLSAFDKRELDVIAAEIDGIYDRNHAEVLYSFGDTDYYLGVNKYRADILHELNDAQNQLYAENPDYLSSLRSKYYSATLSRRAFTKSEFEWISKNNTLTVGYLNNFLPYCSTDKDGKVTGVVSEVIPELLNELGISGITVDYVGYDNYDDMTAAIADDIIDVAFPVGGGLFFSEEDGLYLTNPVITSVTDLVYSSDYKGSSVNNFAACTNNKLQYYYIKTNYPDANMTMYKDIHECLDAVAKGDAGCTTVNGLRTSLLLKDRRYDSLSFIQLPSSEDNCFGVKIGNDGLLKILNRGLNVIDADYAQNIAVRYTQSLYSFTLYDFVKRYIIWFVLIITALMAIIIVFMIVDIRRSHEIAKDKEKAKQEIENANQVKFVFVNKMANYMRDPLKQMETAIGLAKDSNDSPVIDEYLDRISSHGREIVSIINNILTMSRFESGQLQIEDQTIACNLQGKRLLIVEDTMEDNIITSKIMKKYGFEIQIANDVQDAYEKLNAAPYNYFDALLVNVEKLQKDEYNSALRIRKINNPDKAAIPIIAILSDEKQKDDPRYQECNISAEIYKPFELRHITEAFNKIFR